MSKPSARPKAARRQTGKRETSDTTYYFGLAVIGMFIVLMAVLLTDGQRWREAGIVYLALIALVVHRTAFEAYRGKHGISGWQRALARLPLRGAGYGQLKGKPIEAAHGDGHALKIIIASAIVSAIVLGGLLAWVLV